MLLRSISRMCDELNSMQQCLNFAEEISPLVERRSSRSRRSAAQLEAVRVQRQISLTLQGNQSRILIIAVFKRDGEKQ